MMYLASRHVRQMILTNNVINYYVATFIQGRSKRNLFNDHCSVYTHLRIMYLHVPETIFQRV